ncbi:hypothetical protein ACHAWC_002187, partial [Mediolabrus comicus]
SEVLSFLRGASSSTRSLTRQSSTRTALHVAHDDTSTASRVQEATPFLQRIGKPYLNDMDAWENDIQELHDFLHHIRYHHSTIKKHIFNLPIQHHDAGTNNLLKEKSLERYRHEYPFGPTYVRPITAGESIDLKQLIDFNNSTIEMSSLQVFTTLFLLSSCVPKSLFLQAVDGGEETLNLIIRLGIVYLSGDMSNEENELVVPLIHLFPIEIVSLPGSNDVNKMGNHLVKNIVLMTDLHPTVLSMTTIPSGSDEPGEGAVMYIGPDSLSLVQHLHASFFTHLQSSNRTDDMQSFRILDLCCGSGVQALATLGMLELLRETGHELIDMEKLEAVAVDVNKRALRFTEFNARLNGFGKDVTTLQSDLLADDTVPFMEELLKIGTRFDVVLANPPFIPVPNVISDNVALSLRSPDLQNSQSCYGLFSSGGASGEDCLCAIMQMAPHLLRRDGGLMGIVSEFMNPPLLNATETECRLLTKLESWWGTTHDTAASGILFTNEHPLNRQVYSQRRALSNNNENTVSLWLSHLESHQINHVSPGLLFIKYQSKHHEENTKRQHQLQLEYRLVPSSVWTPHNFNAVEYSMNVFSDFFR